MPPASPSSHLQRVDSVLNPINLLAGPRRMHPHVHQNWRSDHIFACIRSARYDEKLVYRRCRLELPWTVGVYGFLQSADLSNPGRCLDHIHLAPDIRTWRSPLPSSALSNALLLRSVWSWAPETQRRFALRYRLAV